MQRVRSLFLPVLFFLVPALFFAQTGENAGRYDRGSIPEELLRPGRGESPRYPADTVIGELGRGRASDSAYVFAKSVGEGLIQGRMNHPGFAAINQVILESYLSALDQIHARFYRLGSGREEPDGAVSFLIRFIGRDEAITGELFIRQKEGTQDMADEDTPVNWVFEELILEQARELEAGQEETGYRSDNFPYERLY